MFNLLEEVVQRRAGPDLWDDLLAQAGVDGAWTSLGNYSDAEMAGLVEAAADRLGMSAPQALRWFGENAMPLLKERYPALFAGHASSRDFILSVNSMIHPEVRKLYSGASCPFFHFHEGPEGTVSLGYNSPRKMCALADGFMRGAARLFCEEVAVSHRSCMHRGDDRCVMELRWVH